MSEAPRRVTRVQAAATFELTPLEFMGGEAGKSRAGTPVVVFGMVTYLERDQEKVHLVIEGPEGYGIPPCVLYRVDVATLLEVPEDLKAGEWIRGMGTLQVVLQSSETGLPTESLRLGRLTVEERWGAFPVALFGTPNVVALWRGVLAQPSASIRVNPSGDERALEKYLLSLDPESSHAYLGRKGHFELALRILDGHVIGMVHRVLDR